MPVPRISVYDTTLRDGTQGEGVSLSVEDKLKIARRLDELGVDYIEGGWPGSNPKDLDFFRRARRIAWKHARVAAFGSTRKPCVRVEEDANVRALVRAGCPVVTIFGKSWDFHVREALCTTMAENLAMIGDTVRFLKEAGKEVIYDAEHFFDGYRANPEYALETLQAAREAGADWIVLCDTNGGRLPSEVWQMVAQVAKAFPVPLGMHAHNDGELAVANSLVAVEAGVRQVQGTVNGYGERCGNANLCSIIPNLQLKKGYQCLPPEHLSHLAEVSHYVAEIANVILPSGQPFVGGSAFAHKAGVHVNAVLKAPQSYEHINPEAVGNTRRVLVSELSGSSNLLYKAEEMALDIPLDGEHGRQLAQEIKRLEHLGYQFEGAEASLELLLRRALGAQTALFDLESFKIMVEKRGGQDFIAEAIIKLRVGEKSMHTAAEGNGPVNAMDNALRKALEQFYPALGQMHLTDYKVRVLDETDGTGAKVRVLIESRDAQEAWSTVGVSENIIEASWQALVDSMEYAIMRQSKAGQAGKTAQVHGKRSS